MALFHSKMRGHLIINVLKFRTLVACQKGLDKQCRPRSDCFFRSSLIRVFLFAIILTSIFLNSSPEKQDFIWERKKKSVQNFRTLTIYVNAMSSCKKWSGAKIWAMCLFNLNLLSLICMAIVFNKTFKNMIYIYSLLYIGTLGKLAMPPGGHVFR